MMDFTINKLNPQTDYPKISKWDQDFKNDPRYETIKNFILEGDTYLDIVEVIHSNHDIVPIGDNEIATALILTNKKQDIIGFLLLDVCDINLPSSTLVIKYIVIHPEYQGKNIAYDAITKIISNPIKYVGVKFNEVFAKVEKNNIHSRKMLTKLGFDFEYTSSQFLKATKTINSNDFNKEDE